MNDPVESLCPGELVSGVVSATANLVALRRVGLRGAPVPGCGSRSGEVRTWNGGGPRDPAQVQRLMSSSCKEDLLAAARRARDLYPGAVGELLYQEIVSWLQFGYMLGSDLIFRVAEELNTPPQ